MNRPKNLASVALVLAFVLAQIPFSLADWVSVGSSPQTAGEYDVVIQATYNNQVGTFPLNLNVSTLNYSTEGLTVEPVYPIDRTPPIELKYEILQNGSSNFIMVSNNLTVYFVSGNSVLASKEGALNKQNDTYWHATVNVPFKGDYKAIIKVVINKSGQYYGGSFMTYFESNSMSPDVEINHSMSKRVMIPAESFDATMEVGFNGSSLPGLDIFKVSLYGTTKKLGWNSASWKYKTSLTAPTEEGKHMLSFFAEDQNYVVTEYVYVADISKAKSGRCPLVTNGSSGSCNDMKDVRKCLSDYKSRAIQVTEQQLVACYEGTNPEVYGSVICEGEFKGDFDGDEERGTDDLEILQNVILPKTQTQRNEYEDCADYDLDGDVDEDDLTCLTNVVSSKWWGDSNGGICLDAKYDTTVKCDLNDDKKITEDDVSLFGGIKNASDNDIEMPPAILETCDFDQNDKINREDETCLNYFVGLELGNNASLLAGGQTIPSTCMEIYNLDSCQGIRGDINGDLVIDDLDELLIELIYRKQITGYSMECADVNDDQRITSEDVGCVLSYTAGDKDEYFVCLNCEENIPQAYLNTYEICGDGYDNNCDGLVDRTSTGGSDFCDCGENTPCWMVKDKDSGSNPGVDDQNVQVCRKVSWSSGSGTSTSTPTSGTTTSSYQWMDPSSLTCDQAKQCKTMLCSDTVYKCAYSPAGKEWKWYDVEEGLPAEDDDPDAKPKSCSDNYDNDCNCGDQKCKKKESKSMFKSGSFWGGAGVGLVAGYVLAGTPLGTVVSLASTGASFLTDDPETKAALSGFGLGLSIGNYVGSSTKYGNAGGDKWKDGVGDKAAEKDRWWLAGSGQPNSVGTSSNAWTRWMSASPDMGFAGKFGSALSGPTANMAAGGIAAFATYKASDNYKEKVFKWKKNETCASTNY